MKIAFTLTDIQDLFLYGPLIDLYIKRGHSIYIYYDKTSSKITSVNKNKWIFKELSECVIIPYASEKDCRKQLISDNIEIVMTNEGMPFKIPELLPCKMYAFSWTIEYVIHGPRFFPICDLFFCDDPIVKNVSDFAAYPKLNVNYDCHPKYLCLNKSREDLCNSLGLNPIYKFVTILGPAPALHYEEKIKDIKRLTRYFVDNGFKILYKYKQKDKVMDIFRHDAKFSNFFKKCSTSAVLAHISDFVLGFNSSGIVESIHTETPFVNLFLRHKKINYKKHWQFRLNNEKVLRLDNYDKNALDHFFSLYQNSKKEKSYPLAKELDI